jgi:hypothetical protein
MSDIVENYMIDSEKHLIAACKAQRARIAELEAAIREYLGEYDTPAKDYAYRAACRERLRKLVGAGTAR